MLAAAHFQERALNRVRVRVKEHLPAVLLTLLGIVQALALELLWSRVRDGEHLYQMDWTAAVLWAQITAVFLGIVVIWVVYASNVMRFGWVPSISDSVYPFVIGIIEFALVEASRPGRLGAWFLGMVIIFAIMNWVTHHTFRRARQDSENEAFFAGVGRARLSDFYPAFATIGALMALGTYFLIFEAPAGVALVAVLGMNVVMLWQLYNASRFWERSIRDPE